MRGAVRLRGRTGRPGWALRIAAFHLALLAHLSDASAGAPQAYPHLFGTRELHSSNLMLFPKWRHVLEQYRSELASCDESRCDRWEALIAEMRDLDRMGQLKEVNRRLNDRPYIVDAANWGTSDYWATPFEFLRRNGDCEDYAIAKYMALRALGFPAEMMRIVVLQDVELRLAHAVLVVYLEGRPLVLDNQIAAVKPADSIHHYQPVYSVNEEGWWLHRPLTLESAAPATQ